MKITSTTLYVDGTRQSPTVGSMPLTFFVSFFVWGCLCRSPACAPRLWRHGRALLFRSPCCLGVTVDVACIVVLCKCCGPFMICPKEVSETVQQRRLLRPSRHAALLHMHLVGVSAGTPAACAAHISVKYGMPMIMWLVLSHCRPSLRVVYIRTVVG
eukprot:scaffold73342_cov33-Tisochrysis_lutea.AAC.4